MAVGCCPPAAQMLSLACPVGPSARSVICRTVQLPTPLAFPYSAARASDRWWTPQAVRGWRATSCSQATHQFMLWTRENAGHKRAETVKLGSGSMPFGQVASGLMRPRHGRDAITRSGGTPMPIPGGHGRSPARGRHGRSRRPNAVLAHAESRDPSPCWRGSATIYEWRPQRSPTSADAAVPARSACVGWRCSSHDRQASPPCSATFPRAAARYVGAAITGHRRCSGSSSRSEPPIDKAGVRGS